MSSPAAAMVRDRLLATALAMTVVASLGVFLRSGREGAATAAPVIGAPPVEAGTTVSALARRIDEWPSDATRWTALGEHLITVGRRREAAMVLRVALTLDPASMRARQAAAIAAEGGP
jgi:cytochrome c-type biogenesis protein CcmH/NrfG